MSEIILNKDRVYEIVQRLGNVKNASTEQASQFKTEIENLQELFAGQGRGGFMQAVENFTTRFTSEINDGMDLEKATNDTATDFTGSDLSRAQDLKRIVTGGAGNAVAMPQ
jgi:uncharacterized protein YukE